MVKQRLKAYEVGDFAYVENVMAGETREREHRRLDTSEETSTTETETTTEREKDLQSTQRNETQTQAEKTVAEYPAARPIVTPMLPIARSHRPAP